MGETTIIPTPPEHKRYKDLYKMGAILRFLNPNSLHFLKTGEVTHVSCIGYAGTITFEDGNSATVYWRDVQMVVEKKK